MCCRALYYSGMLFRIRNWLRVVRKCTRRWLRLSSGQIGKVRWERLDTQQYPFLTTWDMAMLTPGLAIWQEPQCAHAADLDPIPT